MMGGLKLINQTDKNIILYEGTGDVNRPIKIIPAGKKHVLKVDPHETYREYKCKFPREVRRKSEAVVLTSDEIAAYSHVTITWDDENKKLSYVIKKRSESSAAAESKPNEQTGFGAGRWLETLFSKFSWKKDLPPNDGGGGGGGGDGHGGAGGGA